MIKHKEYKFYELSEDLQNDALENVADKMYQDFKNQLFNNFDIMDTEIDELLFNYHVIYTQILEASKKLTFTYWGDIL